MYTINIEYDSSLTDGEKARLKEFETEFIENLEVPCGVTESVIWKAKEYGKIRNRFFELSVISDDYRLLETSAPEMSEITKEWINEVFHRVVSPRWPKDKKV